jgi:hypothetical protein
MARAQKRERERQAERRYAATEHGRAVLAEKQRRRRAIHAEYMRAWRTQNLDHAREMDRKRRVLNSAYLKRKVTKYGITPEHYLQLFEDQNGKCAICGASPDGRRVVMLCVDHSHATGKVRGLLCKVCNLAVGNLRDSAELALATAAYLGRSIP